MGALNTEGPKCHPLALKWRVPVFVFPPSLSIYVCVHKTQVSETEHYCFQEGILDTHFSIIQKEKYMCVHTQTNTLSNKLDHEYSAVLFLCMKFYKPLKYSILSAEKQMIA